MENIMREGDMEKDRERDRERGGICTVSRNLLSSALVYLNLFPTKHNFWAFKRVKTNRAE